MYKFTPTSRCYDEYYIFLLLLLLCYCCYCYYVDKIIRPHLFEKHKMRHVVTDVP